MQQVSTGQPQSMQHVTDVVWKKSSLGSFKCNIHASFSSHLNFVGIGMCIRDDSEDLVLAKT
jgi:hypothetical protein